MTSATTRSANKAKQMTLGQPSWRLVSDNVEAFVTETGGHLGPVTFDRRGRKLKPYSVAPWAEEATKMRLPPIIKVLRGDFFCLPFGGNETPYKGERHPVHGETANNRWQLETLRAEQGRVELHLSLETKIRRGRVDKLISLLDGQNTVYSEHVITGMQGPMNLGHHAMLKFPDEEGSGVISISPFVYGQVFPGVFELPEKGGYSMLKRGAEFRSLSAVPTASGDTADLTRFPARRGFEDLVLMVSDAEARFAWTAVVFPRERYVWFALKDPRTLRETIFWLSNGGRHYAPWSGRHVNVMGLEEVSAYFHYGLAESARKNDLVRRGFPTVVNLNQRKAIAVRYIMGVTQIPVGFDRVVTIEGLSGDRGVLLRSASGKKVVETSARVDFLQAGTDCLRVS